MRPLNSVIGPRNALACSASACFLFGLITLSGCSDPFAKIDERTDKLIAERNAALGANTVSPSIRSLKPRSLEAPGMDADNIPTSNPDASELTFTPAPEVQADQDIADRLRAYADNATGRGPDPDGEAPEEPIDLSLDEAWRLSQLSGQEFLRAEEEYILTAIRLLQQRHLYSPRFFNDTTTELAGFGRDGNFQHAANIINTLRVTQRLPSGGSVEAAWIVRATDQLREVVSDGYQQSSRLAFSADIPLLRGAGPTAREDLIQAERNLIYQARGFERSRRELLVDIARDYFGLIEQLNRIENQLLQIDGLRRLQDSTETKVEAGRLRPFQKQLAANQVLRAEASLASLRESYILSVDRFKIRLGLSIETPIEVADTDLDLEQPAISQAEAAHRALDYRLDLQNQRDQLDDNRRAIRNARNDLLPDLDFAGEIGIPTDTGDDTGGLSYDGRDLDYSVALTLGLPLDRENERLNLRSQIIQLERAVRDYDDFRDNVIVTARQSVRQIDLARFQLQLAEEQVRINELRLDDLELRDDVDPQSVVDAQAELADARNARDSARTDLRTAILNFLLGTGQLRVERDGTLVPINIEDVVPGASPTPAGTTADQPAPDMG